MAAAVCSISRLTAVTGWPEQGKARRSVLPVSEILHSFRPQTTGISVDRSTSRKHRKDEFGCFSLTLSRQQRNLAHLAACNPHRGSTPLPGAAAVMLSVRNVHSLEHAVYDGNVKFVSLNISHS